MFPLWGTTVKLNSDVALGHLLEGSHSGSCGLKNHSTEFTTIATAAQASNLLVSGGREGLVRASHAPQAQKRRGWLHCRATEMNLTARGEMPSDWLP
mmetsp:Transcript_49271/g.114193  ORF Transcript_49271/g.114193 Transcript_49271/m.114193 type:complete len:97 (+) Transcript_49271:966-1256(+)